MAGVRSTESETATQLSAQGVEIRVADYERPETLRAAFEGIDRLLLISSSAMSGRCAQHANVINAAKAIGIGMLAYTSLLHADTSPLGLGEQHRKTERDVKDSGLDFTILRHGWYAENHAASIPHALKHGAVIGSAGDGRFSTATRLDFAEAAAVVLTTGGHSGKTYELAGDQSYSLTEFAELLAVLSGKSVIYKDMPKADFKSGLIEAGLPELVAELIADADCGASQGALEDNSAQLSTLIGRHTTPLQNTVALALS